ncbi:protein trapped in endoderm-1-like [Portunus trituberculatus]|uniref:protein trapped in endoderm-1-like n=1 Tax=Portunus trituberculatus TaxID=210409 RepID=UPI001E1CCA76|nr:protein trapped in endoderm-1-like [Portunus trituberculatus]
MNDTDTYSPELLGVTAAGAFLIAIVGTSGNLLAVVALLQSTTLRQNPSTAFMINLPACLLPICAISMPLFGTGCLQQKLYGRVLISERCAEIFFTMGFTLSQVHLHTICALAFNRFLAVMWPAKYKQLMQKRKVRLYLGLLWLYSVLLWLPLAFGALGGLKYDPKELMASMDNSQGKVQKGFHVFFTYMLPILFTSMCYIIMYIKVRYSRRSRQVRAARKNVANVDDDAVRQWDDHVTRTILVIFVFMVLCCVPHLVVHIRHLYDRHPAAWLLLHLVFWLQFCIDPLVYVTISCQYRAACAETARRLMQCLGLSSREETTERSVCFKERVSPTQIIHLDRMDTSLHPKV